MFKYMKRLYIYGGGSISIETIRLVNKINLKKNLEYSGNNNQLKSI